MTTAFAIVIAISPVRMIWLAVNTAERIGEQPAACV